MALFLFSVFLLFIVVAHLPGGGDRVERGWKATAGIAGRRAQVEQRLVALRTRRAEATSDDAREALDDAIGGATEQLSALGLAQATVANGRVPDRDADVLTSKVHTGWGWLDEVIASGARNPALTLYKLKSYGYEYSWTLIPISLPFLWLLLAFRRDVGLYDHAIFAIYSLSFMSLAVVALAVASAIGRRPG